MKPQDRLRRVLRPIRWMVLGAPGDAISEKDLGYLGNEIPVLLSVFETAASLGHGIVSVLDPPVDPKSCRLLVPVPP
jgi:hypothetical protein